MADVVDTAQRASYQLSSAASSKLRRMTRTSGLPSENVISRVAIVRSLQDPLPDDLVHGTVGGGKEIKGITLLGKRRPASLLIAMICRHAQQAVDSDRLRVLIRFHWERGVNELARNTAGTTVVDWLARRVVGPAPITTMLDRDELARAIGRQHGRWPIEVRRMVANAGRLELGRSLEIAQRLADAVERRHGDARMSEALALEFLRDEWAFNRLGLGPADRELLDGLKEAGERGIPLGSLGGDERAAIAFLSRLGLVEDVPPNVRLAAAVLESGDELWSLR